MTISAILANHHRDVLAASPHESVGEVVTRLAKNRIGALPVVDGSSVVGIFSERDIVYGIAQHGAEFLTKTVADTMTAPAITVTPDTAILSALSLMSKASEISFSSCSYFLMFSSTWLSFWVRNPELFSSPHLTLIEGSNMSWSTESVTAWLSLIDWLNPAII